MRKVTSEDLKKLYYTIGEVADMFEVNASLIRFWEKEFSIIQPKKNKKGNRLFTPKDIENFNKIYDLVKVKGFTLEGAKRELKLKKTRIPEEQTTNLEEVISRLQSIKDRLEKLK